MSTDELLQQLNSRKPQFLSDMGCQITHADPQTGECRMSFDIGEQYCHSGNIIQGGFVTAMLDSVTSHAAFVANSNVTTVSTLEVKVTFLGASNLGKLTATGRVEKMTRNFAFLSGELFNDQGERTASISATAKISQSA